MRNKGTVVDTETDVREKPVLVLVDRVILLVLRTLTQVFVGGGLLTVSNHLFLGSREQVTYLGEIPFRTYQRDSGVNGHRHWTSNEE